MIIEINLIQNFLLATVVVVFFALVIILVRNSLKKKSTNPSQNKPTLAKLNRTKPLQTSNQDINKENPDYKKLIKTAQKHAKNLLYDTTRAASELLTNTKQTNEHMEEHLDKVLQGIAANDIHALKTTTSQFDIDYQQTLQNIQKQLQELAAQAVENTKNSYNEKLDAFTQELLKNGLSTQNEVDKKMAELLAKADSEIEEYKKSKLNRIDEEINNLIQKVYRDVLRISIPENVHQEMIVKSLEEAKKDGMFKL